MVKKIIKWDRIAVHQLDKAIDYIEKNSVKNAGNTLSDILEKINRLPDYPEMYPPDKYKMANDDNYRAFKLHRYRIIYFVGAVEIRIIRIRHTKRKPVKY